MKVSIYNLGCKLNFAEISQVQKQFENAGYDVVDFSEKADVVLINTCTVTHNADADSRKYIRRAIKTNPEAFIAVMGCYSQLKPDEVIAIEGVDAVLGTNNKFNITELIERFEKNDKPQVLIPDLEDVPFHFASSVDNESRTRIVLKIQDGCDYVCSYCTIPFARGKSRSMDFTKLKDKFLELNSSDFHEIVLTGINLGEYKAPSGESFTAVIKYICDSDLNFRVRISSIEPNLVKDEIIQLVKNSEKMCNHFHIPLQSGSPDILRAMKRRYKASTFEDLVYKIKTEIPDCCIGVDVIEGFPGESDIHFQETYDLLNRLPISYLHVFTYSERDAAPASNYTGQIDPHERKIRTRLLRELSENKKYDFIKSQIGKTFRVIPETAHTDDGFTTSKGWTDNYVQVKLRSLHPLTQPVKVTLTHFDKHFAYGEFAELKILHKVI